MVKRIYTRATLDDEAPDFVLILPKSYVQTFADELLDVAKNIAVDAAIYVQLWEPAGDGEGSAYRIGYKEQDRVQ